MLFESNLFTRTQFVYTFYNIEACYDRQDANIVCMVEEVVGAQRNPAMLFTKLFLQLKHYLATSYSISSIYYGGIEDPLCGTEQGNVLTGTGYCN